MTIDILWMAGTGFPHGGDGVSEDFRHWLTMLDADERFSFQYVDFPADFGLNGYSYDESVAQGVSQLRAAVDDSPNEVLIGGYSQGADVAGEMGRMYARGELQGLSIRGVILIADPWRPEGVDGVGGSGIRGSRGMDDMPVLWCSNPGDPITALPDGNPLRSVADIATFMAASVDPVRQFQLWAQVTDAARRGRLQRWWDIKNWMSWRGALAYARGYCFDGRHTTDYVRNGLTATLARQVVDRPWTE